MKRLSSYSQTHTDIRIRARIAIQTHSKQSVPIQCEMNRTEPNRTWHQLSKETTQTNDSHTRTFHFTCVAKPDAHTTQQTAYRMSENGLNVVENYFWMFPSCWNFHVAIFTDILVLFTIFNWHFSHLLRIFYTYCVNSLCLCLCLLCIFYQIRRSMRLQKIWTIYCFQVECYLFWFVFNEIEIV